MQTEYFARVAYTDKPVLRAGSANLKFRHMEYTENLVLRAGSAN